jgi:hypothetical protein
MALKKVTRDSHVSDEIRQPQVGKKHATSILATRIIPTLAAEGPRDYPRLATPLPPPKDQRVQFGYSIYSSSALSALFTLTIQGLSWPLTVGCVHHLAHNISPMLSPGFGFKHRLAKTRPVSSLNTTRVFSIRQGNAAALT